MNPRWERYYATQPEIRAYWENLWHKYDLVKHTRLNTTVRNAQWSNETQRYTLSLENVITKETSQAVAEIMIYAVGGFQEALFPKDILGRENFRGEIFHSAEWRHDVTLKNQRVGVIGNGCSAYVFSPLYSFFVSALIRVLIFSAQFIPIISEDSSVEVVNFCRTPQWYIPRVRILSFALII